MDAAGNLSISAGESFIRRGCRRGDLGLTAATAAASTTGLTNVNVLSVGGANDAILRIDSALTSVSDCAARSVPSRTASIR